MSLFQNILIAEDDDDDFIFLGESLNEIFTEAQVERVNDGVACIKSLQQASRPNLIFLDLTMPVKNGIECLHYIREHDVFNDVAVIIWSSSHNIKDIDKCYKGGATFFVVKPKSIACMKRYIAYISAYLGQKKLFEVGKEKFVLCETLSANSLC